MAIRTPNTVVSLADDIVVVEVLGPVSTGASVAETLDAIRRVSRGRSLPILMDARTWQRGEPAAWSTVVDRLGGVASAAAMLIDPASPPTTGPFPDLIDRWIIPFRLFTDRDEALAFLRSAGSPGTPS